MTVPDLDPAKTLGYLVNRVAAAMREGLEARTKSLGLTAPQASILLGCHLGLATTPAQFRRVHWVDPAAITRLLDQLERKGLVRREPNPKDRRSVLIRLTDRGAEVAPRVVAAARENNERFSSLLGPEDLAVVMHACHRILRYAGSGLLPEPAEGVDRHAK